MQITLFLLVQNLLFGILFVDCTTVETDIEEISDSNEIGDADLLITWNTVYVDYPGYQKGTIKKDGKVTIKIYNERKGDEPVVEYEVPKRNHPKKKIYRFVMRNHEAKDGKYSSQICVIKSAADSVECSKKTTPVELESGKDSDGNLYRLECTRTLKTGDEKVLSTGLEPVDGILNDEYVVELQSEPGTIANQYDIEKNQKIFKIGSEDYTYFAVTYPAMMYREWFRMEDSCAQKYKGIVLTYIVNNKSKLVLKKGKVEPILPKRLYEKYLGLDPKKTEDTGEYAITVEDPEDLLYAPIEILVKVDGIKLPEPVPDNSHQYEHNVYHMACMKTNDGTTPKIKHCAEACIHIWDFTPLPDNAKPPVIDGDITEYDIQPRNNVSAE